MIRTIDIQNFRCYRSLEITDCKRLNVIVGDNGSGKTSLLESIFFALGVTSEIGARFRQTRGMDGAFQGSVHRIEDAMWGNLFYENNYANPIIIKLTGDGPDQRSLVIARGRQEATLPFSPSAGAPEISEPIVLTWTDAAGIEHAVVPRLTSSGAQFPSTGEDLPNFFFFSANQTVSSAENAARFSELNKSRRKQFVDAISQEYPWIEDMSIEIAGGSAAVFASVKDSDLKRALPFLSGGVNRVAGFMLAIASRPKSVVLIDEIENGLYYEHHKALWKRLISFMRDCNSQMFVSTHSGEMIPALVAAAGKRVSDIALWRTVLEKNGRHVLHQFSGDTLEAGIRTNVEVR